MCSWTMFITALYQIIPVSFDMLVPNKVRRGCVKALIEAIRGIQPSVYYTGFTGLVAISSHAGAYHYSRPLGEIFMTGMKLCSLAGDIFQNSFEIDVYQLCLYICSPKHVGRVGVNSVDHLLLLPPLLPPPQLAQPALPPLLLPSLQ